MIQKRSEREVAMQKRLGARSGGKAWSAERRCQKGSERGAVMQKGSERGAEAKHGARSDDVKKGRSVEQRCKKGSERGAAMQKRVGARSGVYPWPLSIRTE